ncbi:CotS family spore coat protein [Halalkalibacter akibai]|uniref:Spore coat protein S n=1 Tax=Halalkalibacter akibai (strain ATCC 43226 / DSM 21942 / CIP 109018 / JCM 9157 / 1139) TaxID=1236973 RepID=W4QXY8_HALA3|nr:CotS family spore coat protein [Halalkalibacter akibai]GAE36508.1 spore coat protein S [Halalkalibacter akibai JCM 9157]
MTEDIIVPWDLDDTLNDDSYVPMYIEEMADKVLTYYDLNVTNRTVVATKADKGGLIWKIETNKGPFSLKVLHRRPTRSLFSLGAQQYLVEEKDARVPPIFKTKSGENFIEMGGKLWFIAEWISLTEASKDLKGAQQLCAGLGEFHRLSKGYEPPRGSEKPSRLYRWPRKYEKMITKMTWFKDIAKAYPETIASPTLLSCTDLFEQQAKEALIKLNESAYSELIKKGNTEWGLVHQDYGWANGQLGPGGVWLIDLDGVAYDIPIRDLRKLITGQMEELGFWDPTWMKGMIEAYHETNPISQDLMDLLIIDMSLPNEFYLQVKDLLYEPTEFMDAELDSIVKGIVESDKTKWPALEELKEWKGAIT